MEPKEFVILALGVIGGIGICLMVAAFALIAGRGGWKQAITRPIAEKRWPAQRWMMAAGAGCGVVMALGFMLLALATRGNVFGGR
jgi:hypothetical protein